MSLYDGFTFSQSCPQYYEWMKNRNPAIFRAIQDNVRNKHWELVGGMWVEPDLNLPDGESLVRQRLYGQRFYLNHFGRISEIAWLPDTFGFAWSIPQILYKSGARYFYTSKPVWNDTTRFPFSTFLWQGPDGTQLLTHVCDLMGKNLLNIRSFARTNRLVNFRQSLEANYNTRPGEIASKLSDILPEAGIFYGWGDGGNGPKTFEVESAVRLQNKGYLEIATAQKFFEKLEPFRERLPVWNDEIYLEFHRGCYTTQAWIKKANREAEIAARNAEIISSMNALFRDPYPGEVLRDNWKKLLFNQFHDILPGSSIPEVYDDARIEYDELFSTLHRLMRDGIQSIGRRINTQSEQFADATPIINYNTLSWRRTQTAFLRLDSDREKEVIDAAGNVTPSQVITLNGHPTLAFTACDLPELGYRTYYLRDKTRADGEAPTPMAVLEQDGSITLENEFLRASVDPETGCVVSMFDKMLEREMLAGPSNRLRLYHDANMAYPAWNIDRYYRRREIEIAPPADPPEIIENGGVVATVQVKTRLENSEIVQKIKIFRDRPLLVFTTHADWHEKNKLLKVDFDTAVKGERVASDIPYGAIERPTRPRLPAQKARWELPAQKWIDLSNGRYGLALLNQDKYGFSINSNLLSLTLLRAPKYPLPVPNAWGLPPMSDRPKHTDQGSHTIRYALHAHPGDWRDGEVWKRGMEFNCTPLVVRTDHHDGILPRESTSLSCRSKTTYIGAIKRPEDNPDKPDSKYHQIVVRLIEATGRPDTVTLKFEPRMTIFDAKETDLLEFSQKQIPDQKIGEVTLFMSPFEIKTVKITLVRRADLEQDQAQNNI